MKTPPDLPSSIERHSRKCAICTHPAREAIDQAFLHRPRHPNIVKDYNLPSLSSLYRHAHATGLWDRHSNRELTPTEQTPPNSNRENKPGSGLLTAEIQRMLIGK
jgi:hypothetical protein